MFGRSSKKPALAPAPESTATPTVRRLTDIIDRAPTVIAPGIRIVGQIIGADAVDLAGSLDGDVHVEAGCRVRRGGIVKGTLRADSIIVEGEIEGGIKAQKKVELGAVAQVRGDIEAHTVALAEGCFFDGRVRMSADGGRQHIFQEKRKNGR
jgi:cytoskeletal protein CcmA (bactofilin family)